MRYQLAIFLSVYIPCRQLTHSHCFFAISCSSGIGVDVGAAQVPWVPASVLSKALKRKKNCLDNFDTGYAMDWFDVLPSISSENCIRYITPKARYIRSWYRSDTWSMITCICGWWLTKLQKWNAKHIFEISFKYQLKKNQTVIYWRIPV